MDPIVNHPFLLGLCALLGYLPTDYLLMNMISVRSRTFAVFRSNLLAAVFLTPLPFDKPK